MHEMRPFSYDGNEITLQTVALRQHDDSEVKNALGKACSTSRSTASATLSHYHFFPFAAQIFETDY